MYAEIAAGHHPQQVMLDLMAAMQCPTENTTSTPTTTLVALTK